MAKSNIEIEITANLKDNATDKAKTVNKELDLKKEVLMLILRQQIKPQKLWTA